jgi:hypothetical protein
VANATAICSSGSCDFSCDAGTIKCNPGVNACEKTSWSFETGLEGWASNKADDGADAGNLTTSTTRSRSGSALAAPITVSFQRYAHRIIWWPCGRWPYTQAGPEAVNYKNRTLRMWVYMQSSSAPSTGHSCLIGYASRGTQVNGPASVDVPLNQWTQVSMSLSQAEAADLTVIWTDCRFNTTGNWSGTIYYDDISVQ